MSVAGSLLSERVEAAAAAAAEQLVKPGIQAAVTGIACVLVPPIILILAPLMMLLMPVLLPIGLVLLAYGLSRAGIVMSFAKGNWKHAKGMYDQDVAYDDATGGTGLSRPPVMIEQGSMRELNSLTAQRGEHLVRQTVSLLRSNVARATHDLSHELQGQMQALQQELHLWVGANNNLKPYCTGQIGWLIRTQPKPVQARQQLELEHTARFHELLSFLPPAHELLSEQAIATLPLPPGKRWGDYCYLLLPGLLTKWYPQYMAQLLADWKRLGLQVGFSPPHLTLPYRLYPGPSRGDPRSEAAHH